MRRRAGVLSCRQQSALSGRERGLGVSRAQLRIVFRIGLGVNRPDRHAHDWAIEFVNRSRAESRSLPTGTSRVNLPNPCGGMAL